VSANNAAQRRSEPHLDRLGAPSFSVIPVACMRLIVHVLEQISVRRFLARPTERKWERSEHDHTSIVQINQQSAAGN
jgi:hypothetical protein